MGVRIDIERNMRNINRNMRSSSTLAAIVSPTRQAILTTLFLRPDKTWYLSELADSLGKSPSSLQREIDAFVRVGILQKRIDGRRSYLKANRDSPVFPELYGLIEKTSGIACILRDAIVKAGGVRIAFIYGSLARGEETAGSDVDVLLFGTVSVLKLSPEFRKVEKTVGRQINSTVFSPDDFAGSIAQRNHFLLTVLRGKKIMLVGAEDELESIARSAKGARAPLKQTRAR